jgi:two-component system NtrC family sensor kinase
VIDSKVKRLRPYRREVIIVAATTAVILATLLMAMQVYRVAVGEVRKRYELLATDLAREAAIGMKGVVDFLSRDLLLLSSIEMVVDPQVTRSKDETLQMHFRTFLRGARELGVSGISVLGPNGEVRYSSAPEELEHLRRDDELWVRLRDPQFRGQVLAGPIFPSSKNGDTPTSLRFLLVTSVGETNTQPSAVLAIHVDLSALIDRFIVPIGSRPGIEAWLLAGDGTLIYHPSRPEMMFRNVTEVRDECLGCHDNFEAQRTMLSADHWSGTYRAGNRGQRVAATHRVRLASTTWTVVVSSPMSEVRVLAGHRFWLFFVLVGISLLAPAVAAVLLLRITRLRSRAEAEAQQSEEMRRLEQQVNQAGRLATIGEMVDSVAHEVNNPAAVALSRCDYVIEEMENGGMSASELREDLATVRKQIERIVGITQQLLRFSRRLPYEPQPVAMHEVVQNAESLLDPRLRSRSIRVLNQLPDDLPPVWGDPQQIEQVLINLLQNAADAIEDEGIIRITAEQREREGREFVVLCVEDNGRGISRDDLRRIFEPFFTTKAPGKGTGLGLSICQRIVRRHGGKIEVDSQPGKGSRFFVWLPLSTMNETVV